jgi:hypothetical protein
MAGGRMWDNEQTTVLEECVRKGFSNKKTALRLGRSVVAIRNRKSLLGLPKTVPATCPNCARSFNTPVQAPRSHCTDVCAAKHRAALKLAARVNNCCPCGKPLPDHAVLYCSQACNNHAWYERVVADPAAHAARLEAHRDYLAGHGPVEFAAAS